MRAHISRLISPRMARRPLGPCVAAALLLGTLVQPSMARADVTAGVSDERVSLPDGPGSVGGLGANATVDPHHGAMRYSVTIEAPEGFGGLTPALDLSYSSTGGTGLVGIGWSMATPSIERMTSRGLPTYSGDDLFAADGGDELVQVSKSAGDATYRARYEKGFVKYTWHSVGAAGYWTAELPDGRKSFYGAKPDGTLVDSAQVKTQAGGVFRYMLTTTVDPFGHELRYKYTKTQGGYPLLDEIDYLIKADGSPRFSVRFAYETRDDKISDGSPGFELLLDKRLKEIRVFSEAAQLRRASLTYEESAKSGGASRLASVEQFGLNDAPDPVHFTFAYSQGLGGSCSSASCGKPYVVDMGTLPGNVLLNAGKATMIDINGDSLPDVLATDPSGGKHTFYLSKMSPGGKPSFDTKAVESQKGSSSLVLGLPAVQVMDINGDGFTDIVNAKTRDFRCNDGSGDWSKSDFCLGGGSGDMFSDKFSPADDPNDSAQDPLHVRFFDFDHDRKIDWLRTESQGSTVVSRNTGSGFEAVTVSAIGEVFDEGALQLADMNGDGLQDPVMVQTSGAVRYRLNLGRGSWSDWRQVSLGGLDATQLGAAHVEDINGDGLHDIVVIGGNQISYLLNRNGEHFDAAVVIDAADVEGDLPTFDPKTTSVSFADMNGNGSNDIVWVTNTGSVRFLELFPVRPNLLTRIENGVGQVQVIGYTTSVAEQARDEAAGSPWKYKLPHSMNVVTSMDTWVTLTGSDSGGLHEIVKYRYGSGYYDGPEAQFRGFERVETERVGDASQDSQDPGLKVTTTDVGAQDRYRNGLTLSEQSYSLAGGQKVLLREDRMEYGDCQVADVPASGLTKSVRFVCETASVAVLVEGDPSNAVTTRVEKKYDGYGNVTLESNLGVVNRGTPEAPMPCGACPPGSPFGQICGDTCQGDELYTETSYVVPGKDSGGAWQLHRPFSVLEYGKPGDIRHESLTFYDGEPFVGAAQGTLTKGFVSRVMKRVGMGADEFAAASRNRSDQHGNVVETLDPLGSPGDMGGHRRVYTYDPLGHRVIRAEILLTAADGKPYSLRRDVTYDATWDKVSEGTAWMTVEGGEPTSARNSKKYRYDALGRKIKTVEAGDQEETPTQEYAYDFGEKRVRVINSSRSVAGGAVDMVSVRCLDGMGREYQRRVKVADGSYQVNGFVEFNKKGNPVRSYLPYVAASDECDTAPPTGVPFESQRYDALDRPVETTHADGTVTRTAYLPLGVADSDENDTDPSSPHHDTPTIRRLDGLGRVSSVERYLDPTTPSVTRLEYDGLGRLSAHVDALGHRHAQSHDLLDRVVKIEDANAGTITIEYDAADNEVRRVDARGVVVRRAYDGANRPVAVWDDADEAGTAARATYDKVPGCGECSNVAGLPATAVISLGADALTPTGTSRFGYDAKGRRIYESHSLEAHEFALQHAYDNVGRLLSTSFPDGQSVTRTYDGASRVSAIPGVIDAVSFTERGEVQKLSYANGSADERAYDARLRLHSIKTKAKSGATLLSTTITRDGAGNVTAVDDDADARPGRPSRKLSATYDAWNRMTEATIDEGGPQAETLKQSFDEADRILSATSSLGAASPAHVGAYTYGESQPMAARAAGGMSMTYDAAGSAVARNGLLLERDLHNRVRRVTEGGALREAFAYDPSGARVLKLEDGGATYIVGDEFEVRDGVAVVYPRLGKMRVARMVNDKLAAALLSDLAPATDAGGALSPAGDGHITPADTWLAQAASVGLVKLSGGPTPSPVPRLLRASARRLLMEDSAAVAYLHHDHLDSIVLSTSDQGELLDERAFYPMGSTRAATGFLDGHGFTGQEHDAITDMLHFQFREYDAALGRWAEADPLFSTVTEQSFASHLLADVTSSYGYVGNNPLTSTDPLGLAAGNAPNNTPLPNPWANPPPVQQQPNLQAMAHQLNQAAQAWHQNGGLQQAINALPQVQAQAQQQMLNQVQQQVNQHQNGQQNLAQAQQFVQQRQLGGGFGIGDEMALMLAQLMNHGAQLPGGNQPGGNQPGGNQPGGNHPGGNQPGGNHPPGGNQHGNGHPPQSPHNNHGQAHHQ